MGPQPSLRRYYLLIAVLLLGIIYVISSTHSRPLAEDSPSQDVVHTHNAYTKKLGGETKPKLKGKPEVVEDNSISSKPDEPKQTEENWPELTHFTRVVDAGRAKHLMLVITRDENSWSQTDGKQRTVEDYVSLLEHSGIPTSEMSIAISTTTKSAYDRLVRTLPKFDFAKIQVLLITPVKVTGAIEEPTDRHSDAYQPFRRQQIAMARNSLMLRAVGNEEHIFWYDADVIRGENGILSRMLDHVNDPEAHLHAKNDFAGRHLPIGIMTARVQKLEDVDYDRNAWSHGEHGIGRKTPTPEELEDLKHGKLFVPSSSLERVSVETLTGTTGDDDIFWLDSVGGVVLYMKAQLVRMGLNFPSYYVVGTAWDRQNGWDGIETEGVCYIANTMGYGCYGLGGRKWHVYHAHN